MNNQQYKSTINPIGRYKALGNSYLADILVGGIPYPSVEHAFQAAKVSDIFLKHKISKTTSLAEVEKLLEDTWVRPNWEEVKYATLHQLMKLKFQSSKTLKDLLISTTPSPLGDPKDARVGRILMEVRNEISGRVS